MEPPHAQHQTGSHHSVRNHTGPSFYDELTREGQDENDVEVTSLRSVSVRLPPKPQFQFVQDNQVSEEILVSQGNRRGANRCKQVLFTTSHILSLEKSRHVVSLLPALPLHSTAVFPLFWSVFLCVIATWCRLFQFGRPLETSQYMFHSYLSMANTSIFLKIQLISLFRARMF